MKYFLIRCCTWFDNLPTTGRNTRATVEYDEIGYRNLLHKMTNVELQIESF